MATLSLSSVRQLFRYKAVDNPGHDEENWISYLSGHDRGNFLEGRPVKEQSTAERMEETLPKEVVPVESMHCAPMIDERKMGPSSLPEVNQWFITSSPRASGALTSPVDEKVQAGKKRPGLWCRVFIILGILVAIALALGVGLGVGLHKPKPNHSSKTLHQGAMDGSGVVAIDLDNTTKITAYTQRYDGVLVRSEYQSGLWSGGDSVGELNTARGNFNEEMLVARNGTPLMALSYEGQGELLWHVFYVTADNYLSDWRNSNISQSWSQGTLRSGNFKVSDSPSVGLSACVNKAWYGSPYNISGLGIRLYYGRSDNIIQELGWSLDGPTTWFKGASFPNSNGAGGVECTVRGASITYVWMENSQGQLQQMWYDFNLSANTATHLPGTWVAGLTYSDFLHNSAISAINDFTAVPPTKNVHFQAQNLSIVEIISNGTAENDTWARNVVVGTEPGRNGTRIGSVVLETGLGGMEIHVLFQTNSTNMRDFVRGLTDRIWAVQDVPVGV